MTKFPPLSSKISGLLHGADYNPEQWLESPDVLIRDVEMMKEACCNVMSVGIFSWSALEPEEGHFTFGWMDQVLDRLHENGISVFLATPSGARPAWMSQKYPEVLRVGRDRVKALHGGRHNHCMSSPVYAEKVQVMNSALAKRYAHHPAVIGWHISNEYGGECHCDFCQTRFRDWLKARYVTLDALNKAWWSTFWSHTYTDWAQIESPSPQGESGVHGLNLDWRRFNTDQVARFYSEEIRPLKAENPALPATTNFMEYFYDYDYWKLASVLDFISWDSYPMWHTRKDDIGLAAYTAMYHDLMRTLKQGKPFVLMESTPSFTNWQPVSKLKKPGMHILSSLQAVAHGSDSVQYFQWRKSRGSSEKFHGAVVDHVGHIDTRVGREVSELGRILSALAPVAGSRVEARVAIIFDWESRWAMDDSLGPRNEGLEYENTVAGHYRALWSQGIAVDVINADCDLTGYDLVIAPMLYMVRAGVGERITAFVQAGGRFVATYWSGIVNETDLCFLSGFPGPLRPVLGIWAEEIDSLTDDQHNSVSGTEGNALGLNGPYRASKLCEVIHLEGAAALATYGEDFYAGTPAVTVNLFGKGQAYYLASRNDQQFHADFYTALAKEIQLPRAIETDLPEGVTAARRTDGENEFIFLQNYAADSQTVTLPDDYRDMVHGGVLPRKLTLPAFGCQILSRRLSAIS
ncbi:beta-galactosidase [Rahnella sp. C60]|uniref:beta-galactosidase n=1 Tax=Rahnella perminowiae TaxID=2816244 RepID=UPI001C26C22E|nr:beta-galactosidase [Rahnella perminowiae]MBU9810014.1 beta-galactosidase [Rahnella perminowiae]MBU9816557.1 beta-galactosidase [Rahnella perminowiae]